MYKTCSKCGLNKPLENFNFKNRKQRMRNSHCRNCTKIASKKAYRKRRQYYISENNRLKKIRKRKIMVFLKSYAKSKGCIDCHESDPTVLQFDHVRGSKKNNIGTMLAETARLDKIQDELKKCEVRCANCHARKTAKERKYYMYTMQVKERY